MQLETPQAQGQSSLATKGCSEVASFRNYFWTGLNSPLSLTHIPAPVWILVGYRRMRARRWAVPATGLVEFFGPDSGGAGRFQPSGGTTYVPAIETGIRFSMLTP